MYERNYPHFLHTHENMKRNINSYWRVPKVNFLAIDLLMRRNITVKDKVTVLLPTVESILVRIFMWG
jgi:hypothetical protein